MKRQSILLVTILLLLFLNTGCGNSNTIQLCIVSNEQYSEQEALESVKQPESVAAGKAIYASVNYIESPKGMEYTGTWYIDGEEVKSEKVEAPEDKHGVMIFSLDSEKVNGEKLKFTVLYKKDVLYTKEISIK